MKKIAVFFILGAMFFNIAQGQSDLTFYHMGGFTPQSSINNASFFPDAEFYFSLPGISGLNTKINTRLSYNQLMQPVEGTDSVKLDLHGALAQLSDGDNLRMMGDVSIFQFGVRSGHRAFSLFANIRFDGGFNYPVSFLNYFVNGNGNFIGERVEESRLRGGGIVYNEVGLGYSQEIIVMTDKILRVGTRVKYLHGIAHASVSDDASVTMLTDPNSFDINVNFNNATIRTAGLNEIEGENMTGYAIGFGQNRNTGFAFDLGADMDVNDKLNVTLAVNDIGFINWKQDIESHTFQNEGVVLGGFDDVNDIDIADALEDSLDAWTATNSTVDEFKTAIGARVIAGANYLITENGYVSGSIAYKRSSYNSTEFGYGIGYTHQIGRVLTLSSTVSKDQFRSVKVGGGFGIRVGSLQLYGVFDDVLNAARSTGDIRGLDARIGLNFVIGRSSREKKERVKVEKEELSPFPPEYDLDHLLNDEDDGSSKF
ncbi:DUF5723 family protein [Ekhidna sp.]